MIGSDMGNPVYPVLLPANEFQYDMDGSTSLQFYESCCSNVDPLSYNGSEHVPALNPPIIKRVREAEVFTRQQKYRNCLNSSNFCQDTDLSASFVVNPNPVSAALRLSNDDHERRNSSVTSTSGRTTEALPVPVMLSLGNNLKNVIDQQKEEFDCFIRVQEERMAKGVKEMKQRHMVTVLSAIEKGVKKQLMEKDKEIENLNLKNKELNERIQQVTTEVESWYCTAKYNETMVNFLKNNLNKVIAEQWKEGTGDSDDVDQNNHVSRLCGRTKSNNRNLTDQDQEMSWCRVCMSNEVSILLYPCRHLCLCKECEELTNLCPVCNSTKTKTIQVYIS